MTQTGPALSVDPKDYYVITPTKDPDGGTTITKTDGSGAITQIVKNWPDGDKTVIDIDTDTNVVTTTETPKGQPSLTPVKINPGDTTTTGKTTITNNEPTSITIIHKTTGTDTEGNPTTGTDGETVTTPEGTRTYSKSGSPAPVFTTKDGYYVNTTTNDPDGGTTITRTDGGGAVTQVTKNWPDGDKTVVTIDKTGNAVFTETPKGKPSLPSQTVAPGGTTTIGKTTLTNNEPTGAVTLTHQTTTGKTIETVDHDGTITVTMVTNPVSGNGENTTTTGTDTDTTTTNNETGTDVDGGTAVAQPTQTTGTETTGTKVEAGQAVAATNNDQTASVSESNATVSTHNAKATDQGKLPQTNEQEGAEGAVIGLGLLGGLLAALGLKRRKRDDE
ncbi:hypothetical protein FD04_GL001730 [Secundilactobacillus odoratitofui DSM 19909 = JCM 15043]|uniref:Gram-positive cocci surface proteins LPxTG domain-containing protein n=3 Tax=Secundilactobacillus odoratitofui TaxID=480930 RepID=A0A0R1LMR0_9LACO|nr:hypothetical protein FD04_GL001730 [Secundilactobacillus odoratitofui DSM 19909 = JCM 15043]